MSDFHRHAAPWTDHQVDAFNAHQGRPDCHPYTCAADGTMGSIKHSDRRILRATNEGWVCDFNGCGYRQPWAYVGHVVPPISGSSPEGGGS